MGILASYSKTFLFTFINDDHYFAHVAVAQNLLNGFSRIGWGLCYDRFGFRYSYALISLPVCLATSTLPLLPLLGDSVTGRVCYAAWLCLIYSTAPGIYTVIAAEVSRAFGPVHYQANFGLLYTHYLLYTLLVFVLNAASLDYTPLFLLAGLACLLGLAAILCRSPAKPAA